MTPFALYLLQVALCSGILTGYYWLALRNRPFHRWNRFYLLVAVVLSLAAPLLKINMWNTDAASSYKVLKILDAVTVTGEEVVVESGNGATFPVTTGQLPMLLYTLVSVLMLLIIAVNVFGIFKLLRSYPKTKLGKITFLNTHAPGTPFSFFHFIVWNAEIDFTSATGRQVFEHELAHVQQKHTWDKLFLLLILIPFWCNPFFWVIREELQALHEFAADEQAVRSSNAAELAQLILSTAFPQQRHLFTNPFFQSTIKRRIAMFTKLQNPKASYLSRIIALPFLLFVTTIFMLKTAKAKTPFNAASNEQHGIFKNEKPLSANDTLPKLMHKNKEVIRVEYIKEEMSKVEVMYKDGTKETITAKEAGNSNLLNADTNVLTVFTPPVIVKDTSLKRVYNNKPVTDVQYFEWPKKEVHVFFSDGTKEFISVAEAFKANLFDSGAMSQIEHRPWANEKDANTNIEGVLTVRNASVEEAQNFQGPVMLNNKVFNGTFQQLPVAASEIAYISVIKGNVFEKELVMKPGDSMLYITTKTFIKASQRTGNDPLFTEPEVPAKFPDTDGGWQIFLQKNLDANVPVKKGSKSSTYKVMVGFIVDMDGKIHDIKPLTKHGFGMEEEVVRLMKLSPDWIPAQQNGKMVTSYRKQTVTFVIPEG